MFDKIYGIKGISNLVPVDNLWANAIPDKFQKICQSPQQVQWPKMCQYYDFPIFNITMDGCI